jgi:hypothetical protein
MTKTDEQVEKELVTRYGVSALRLKELSAFVETIGEFTQYLGTNQYYSEDVNKKVALLNVDAQSAALECEELIVRAGALRDAVKQSVFAKKKSFPEKPAFTEKIGALEKKLFELNGRALALTRELRCEFGKKGFTASV